MCEWLPMEPGPSGPGCGLPGKDRERACCGYLGAKGHNWAEVWDRLVSSVVRPSLGLPVGQGHCASGD